MCSRLTGNVALALAAVAVTILGLEVALRVAGVRTASYHAIAGFTVYDPELGWKLAPSREMVFRGAHFAVRVSQNAQGLRDRGYPYEREPGRARILVLGDSVVWCWGVEQADCFTERLEAGILATDVINTGVPGYSTAQEMMFYEREGRRYHPDLVLLVVVANDFTDNLDARGPRFRVDDGHLVATNLPLKRRKNVVGEWLQEHSRLFAHVSYLSKLAAASLRKWRGEDAAGSVPTADTPKASTPLGGAAPRLAPAAPVDAEGWRLGEALMDRLADDVRRDGARLAVVLESMSPAMAGRQLAFWGARQVPVLELAPVFAEAERHAVRTRLDGDPHISSAGQEVVARALRAFLEREGLLPNGGASRTR